MILDLRQGLSNNQQYNAWKFPGGEIHFKLNEIPNIVSEIFIQSRIQSSEELMFLILVIDTIKKDYKHIKIEVFIPYFPYAQADRNFGIGECFSLKTITNILNALNVDKWVLYDPHSDITPGFLNASEVVTNADFIRNVISKQLNVNDSDIVILSPDAGAYKKIYKLASSIEFGGEIASANKYRSIASNNIESIELSKSDFGGKNILIIDDICIGGRTFIELAKKLKEKNCGNLYLAVSHGIFSNGYGELQQYFTNIFTTNSRSFQVHNDKFVKTYDIWN